jgi:hypothetical protein
VSEVRGEGAAVKVYQDVYFGWECFRRGVFWQGMDGGIYMHGWLGLERTKSLNLERWGYSILGVVGWFPLAYDTIQQEIQ